MQHTVRSRAGSPALRPLGRAHPYSSTRASSTVLSQCGAEPSLQTDVEGKRGGWGHLSCSLCCPGGVQGPPSYVMQLVRDRTSSPALITLGPALLPATGSKGWGRASRADKGSQGQLCCSQVRRAGSPVSLTTGSSLGEVHSCGEGWGCLSQVWGPSLLLQYPARVRASCPRPSQGQGWLNTALSFQHEPLWLYGLWTSM